MFCFILVELKHQLTGKRMATITGEQLKDRQHVIAELLKNLDFLIGKVDFGKVELIFHQGRLVQIEKSEKHRLD